MPTIYDNREHVLLPRLQELLSQAVRADFCVGYMRLRGWRELAPHIEHFEGGGERCCRVLVGMFESPRQAAGRGQAFLPPADTLDGPARARRFEEALADFRAQLERGLPTHEAEAALRQLARQLRSGKVRVRLFLDYPLHAKLYLIERSDSVSPLVGFVGSSNLTLAGLQDQGELNIDVVEQDAARKLQRWFDERWDSAVEVSERLAELIEASWAAETPRSPYHVYLKMAYHLSEDARVSRHDLRIPGELGDVLLDFQAAAVTLVTRLMLRRGGALLGDVVGLGKTLMATAVARILQQDEDANTLIICPPKLIDMWQHHVDRYGLAARVVSLGQVTDELPTLQRFRTVIIDESHLLRNREGKRYQAVQEYIRLNEPRVLLLTATPYNKHYHDLSNQLRLFLDEHEDLGIRPERFFAHWFAQGRTEADFRARYQCSPRSLRAFEESDHPDDWRDLMRLFLVRRTRRFVLDTYATYDPHRGRHYVLVNGRRQYFPVREPRTLHFPLDPSDPQDQYARLLSDDVLDLIASLHLPRYGLREYLRPGAERELSPSERRVIENLNRAGRRLIGFCRTNLYKRLESSGASFLASVERHVLRNLVVLHALRTGQPVPIGTLDPAMLDPALSDLDPNAPERSEASAAGSGEPALAWLSRLAADTYRRLADQRAGDEAWASAWLPARVFTPELEAHLDADARALARLLDHVGPWRATSDRKLGALLDLLARDHGDDKVLVFSEFADTVAYLERELRARGLDGLAAVTSDTEHVGALVRRFSPGSNGGLLPGERELRVLLSTDVLAEGQNLQDAHVVVNYDLPWAIVRLVQRAGRVDRIGQQHESILVYSFVPADGLERVLRLRQRLLQRLRENAEVVGADEVFFGGADEGERWHALYTEQAGALDDAPYDEDVDLTSLALQAWQSASEQDRQRAQALPPVVYATRHHRPRPGDPAGVLVYLRVRRGEERHDMLLRTGPGGELVSQSAAAVFRAAACGPDTEPRSPRPDHFALVEQATRQALGGGTDSGGQLGPPSSPRSRLYQALRQASGRLPAGSEERRLVDQVIDAVYRYPLTAAGRDFVRRQLRLGRDPVELARLAVERFREGNLVVLTAEDGPPEVELVCSLGLREPGCEEDEEEP